MLNSVKLGRTADKEDSHDAGLKEFIGVPQILTDRTRESVTMFQLGGGALVKLEMNGKKKNLHSFEYYSPILTRNS